MPFACTDTPRFPSDTVETLRSPLDSPTHVQAQLQPSTRPLTCSKLREFIICSAAANGITNGNADGVGAGIGAVSAAGIGDLTLHQAQLQLGAHQKLSNSKLAGKLRKYLLSAATTKCKNNGALFNQCE